MTRNATWNNLSDRNLRLRAIELLEQRNPSLPIGGRPTRTSWTPLPFYGEGNTLIRVEDERWPPSLALYVLNIDDTLECLDGTSPPIHHANAAAPIRLTSADVWDYLRFFCFFVRGELGPFYVIEDRADPNWPTQLSQPLQFTLERVCRATDRHPAANAEGRYKFETLVNYGGHFFEASFEVQASGMVEMVDDLPIVSETPCVIDAPIRPDPTGSHSDQAPAPSSEPVRVSQDKLTLMRHLEMPSEGPLRQEMERYRCLLAPTGLRQAPGPETFLREMKQRAPHMADAVAAIADHLRMSWCFGDGRLKLPPTLFVGPPGCGKSWLARRLCELLDVHHLVINAGGSNDNRFLCGTSRGWATAEPSAPVRLLAGCDVANPILIIEEIDKAGGSKRNGDPHASLLTMIDPTTATHWTDEYLAGAVDISHINWILTANSITGLPLALRDRLTVISVEAPTSEQVELLLDQVAEEVVRSYGGTPGGASLLSHGDRAALLDGIRCRNLGLRDLRRAIIQTMARSCNALRLVN